MAKIVKRGDGAYRMVDSLGNTVWRNGKPVDLGQTEAQAKAKAIGDITDDPESNQNFIIDLNLL